MECLPKSKSVVSARSQSEPVSALMKTPATPCCTAFTATYVVTPTWSMKDWLRVTGAPSAGPQIVTASRWKLEAISACNMDPSSLAQAADNRERIRLGLGAEGYTSRNGSTRLFMGSALTAEGRQRMLRQEKAGLWYNLLT